MDKEIFVIAPKAGVIVCRQCKYGVRRSQVKAHLEGQAHRLPNTMATQVSEAVRRWNGVSQDAEEGVLPRKLDEKIPELPEYEGLLCRREDNCDYVCRTEGSMKTHWRNAHAWSLQEKRGGTSNRDLDSMKEKFGRFTRRVDCQQMFTSQAGRQFIHIEKPEEEMVSNMPYVAKNQVEEFIGETMDRWLSKRREASLVVEKDDKYLVNPWLRRTGWADYLAGRDIEEAARRMDLPDDERSQSDVSEATVREV